MRALYPLVLFLCVALLSELALAAAGKGKDTKRSGKKVDIHISDSDDEQGPSSSSSGDLYNPDWDTEGGELDNTPRPVRGRPARSRGRAVARGAGPSTRSSAASGRSVSASTSRDAQQQSRETREQESADPLGQDDPVDSRPPTPETPESVGRRYLALQADPPNQELYMRPDVPVTLPGYPETDRHLTRTVHPHFIFNDGSRLIRFRELIEMLRLTIHRLEVETEADAILLFNRREDEAKDANVFVTRGIAARLGFSNAALNWLDGFRRVISGPRHDEYVRLRQQCDDDLAAHEADLRRRAEAAAALRESDEAAARMTAPPVHEQRARTPPQTRSRTASRRLSPARSSRSRASRSRSRSSHSESQPGVDPLNSEVLAPQTPVRLQVPVNVIDLCTPSPPPASQPLICPNEPAPDSKGKGKAEKSPEPPAAPAPAAGDLSLSTSQSAAVEARASGYAAAQRGDSIVSSSDAEEAAELEYDRELARACAESIKTAQQEEHMRRTQVDGQRIASTSGTALDVPAPGGSRSATSRPASAASHRHRAVQLPEHITAELDVLQIPQEHWPAFEQTWRAYDGREYPARFLELSEHFDLGLDEDDAIWLGAVFLRKT